MKKLTCIAIDDEPIALLIISQFCERKGGLELTTFSEPLTGLREIARRKPDLVFLDIEMNSTNGLDIAHALPPESCLIFTTAHAQYALDGSPMNFPINGAWDKSKALMVSGDFSQLVYSIRQDVTFKLFTEGVVQNTDGTIAYNLMQNDMVALRAVMRMGWEIPNPINALAKDKTKRCPFSILKAGE